MKGSSTATMPTCTAKVVYIRRRGSSIASRVRRTRLMGPVRLKIIIHPKVRTSSATNIGTTTSTVIDSRIHVLPRTMK